MRDMTDPKIDILERRRLVRRRYLSMLFAVLAAGFLLAWKHYRESTDVNVRLSNDLSRIASGELDARMREDERALVALLETLATARPPVTAFAAELASGKRDFYTEADDQSLRRMLATYVGYRTALYRIFFYYGRHETAPKELRSRALLLAYTAGLTLYSCGIFFVESFKDLPLAIAKLNEGDLAWDLRPGVYDEVRARLVNPKNRDLLARTSAAYDGCKAELVAMGPGPDNVYEKLRAALETSRDEIGKHSASVWGSDWDLALRQAEKSSKFVLYGLVTSVSTWMGDNKLMSPRGGAPLITHEQIHQLRPKLRPGDILIERRNWFYSNAFLPGYWPHAALYVGTPEEIEKLGIATDPHVAKHLATYRGKDDHGDAFALIEAISEGVVFTSLEHSAHCDSLAVLRPRLDDAKRAAAIARAFSHVGKPYDFDFDFFSTDKLVCTELVYRIYEADVKFPLKVYFGKKGLPAIDIIRLFADEMEKPDHQLDFVSFLDGDEGSGIAVERDAPALRDSRDRSGLTLLN